MSNIFVINSDAYWLASGFFNDPYYNVVIVGDQVWVEPRYITSSFGYWPRRAYYGSYSYYSSFYHPYYYDSWYYDRWYYSPYYYGGYPYYSYSYFNGGYPYYNNYVSSASYNYGRRDYATGSSTNIRTNRTDRELPENYIGRDIRSSSTVKSGMDRQSVSTRQTRETTNTRIATGRDVNRTSNAISRENKYNRNNQNGKYTNRR